MRRHISIIRLCHNARCSRRFYLFVNVLTTIFVSANSNSLGISQLEHKHRLTMVHVLNIFAVLGGIIVVCRAGVIQVQDCSGKIIYLLAMNLRRLFFD